MRNPRFLKVMTAYPSFVVEIERELSDRCDLTYDEAKAHVDAAGYGVTPAFARYFGAAGWDADTIWANIPTLLRLWATEHLSGMRRRDAGQQVLLEQIVAYRPDVLYLEDLHYCQRELRRAIRERCETKPLLVGWNSAPTRDFSVFADLDLVLTCAPSFVRRLRDGGAKAMYFRLSFDEEAPVPPSDWGARSLAFSFVGALGWENGPHRERHRLLESLLAATDIELWGRYGAPRGWRRDVLNRAYRVRSAVAAHESIVNWLDRLPPFNRVCDWTTTVGAGEFETRWMGRVHQAVFGNSYLSILQRSRVTLNLHIDVAEQYAANARLFEATGMGVCLLTDRKENLRDLFEVDSEVVDFATQDEALEKYTYLRNNPETARAIAAAGRRRTLREHTHAHRAEELRDVLEGLRAKRCTGAVRPAAGRAPHD